MPNAPGGDLGAAAIRAVRVLCLAALLGPALAAAQPSPNTVVAVPPPSGRDEYAQPTPDDGTLVYNFSQHPLVNVADGAVQVTAENSSAMVQHGYTPLRVFVANIGKQEERVALEFSYRGSGSATVRRDVVLGPGTRQAVTLLVPAGITYGQLSAAARGITDGGRAPIYFTSTTQTILAIGTDQEFQAAARRAPDYNAYQTLVRTVPREEAPIELPAYVGFNEVVVLSTLEELSDGTRAALEAYAATGGMLVVTRPSRGAKSYLPLLADVSPGSHPYGFGYVRLCSSDAAECARAIASDLNVTQKPVRPLAAAATRSTSYTYDTYGNAVPERERFLLPHATAPVGRFLLIILAFTVAIGPGSVWVARKKGPPMLLVSIPATAAVTCLLIVGYSVIVDGFSIHASTRGYTLLDSKNKRAITVGVEAFYANVSPGDASFDTTTALIAPPWQYNSEQVASVDWTQGAKLGDDFIPSRTYREWGLVSVSPTRARLVARLSGDGNELEVQNALGSEIRLARVRIGNDEFVVRNVRDGASGTAQRNAVAPSFDYPEFLSRFDPRIASVAKGALQDGEFVAHVEGPSMLPVGGLRLSQHSAEHVIRGEVER